MYSRQKSEPGEALQGTLLISRGDNCKIFVKISCTIGKKDISQFVHSGSEVYEQHLKHNQR